MIYTKCESVLSVRHEERVCVVRQIHSAVSKAHRMMGRVMRVLRVPPSDGYWLLCCFEFICIPGHVTTTKPVSRRRQLLGLQRLHVGVLSTPHRAKPLDLTCNLLE